MDQSPEESTVNIAVRFFAAFLGCQHSHTLFNTARGFLVSEMKRSYECYYIPFRSDILT